MTGLPDQVVLGPHAYSIDSTWDATAALRAEARRGDSHVDSLRIWLDVDHPATVVAETLLHEVMHLCWSHASLGEIEQLASHEEHVIAALAPLVLEALRRNPEFAEFLVAP